MHTSVNLRSAAIKSGAGTASVAGDRFLSARQLFVAAKTVWQGLQPSGGGGCPRRRNVQKVMGFDNKLTRILIASRNQTLQRSTDSRLSPDKSPESSGPRAGLSPIARAGFAPLNEGAAANYEH
jgi:hypothetical protein